MFHKRLLSPAKLLCCIVWRVAAGFLLLLLAILPATAAPESGENALRVYFVDVEGGQATLFVTPANESLLIDTGWPGHEGRDADRIVAAAKNAGINKIDYVLITHFHTDHVGGLPQLAAKIPINAFIDHGDNRESTDAETVKGWNAYEKLLASKKYKRITLKPGDPLPVKGLNGVIVSADGVLLDHPLPGAGAENPSCKDAQNYPADQTENARSLGSVFTFGKVRILDLGDLTSDKEMGLVCPQNKLGKIDIYIVSHHGWSQSGSPALLNAIAPRVAIMDNGAKKGGTPSTWDIIEKSPNLENLWQLHYSDEGGSAHNVPAEFIANVEGPDTGKYLKLTAWPDGKFEVFNSRTQQTKQYPAK
jgi:competence protein ComEC